MIITGDNFTDVGGIVFGPPLGTAAEHYRVIDDEHIEVVTPFGDPGLVDVQLYGAGGDSVLTSADHFTYDAPSVPVITGVTPDHGPDIGGNEVTVTGTNLNGVVDMTFGSTDADSPVCTPTSCIVTAPSNADGHRSCHRGECGR